MDVFLAYTHKSNFHRKFSGWKPMRLFKFYRDFGGRLFESLLEIYGTTNYLDLVSFEWFFSLF